MFTALSYQEEYVWPFSRYSVMLRSLAERGELAALTNAVIRFDKSFNPNKDPQDLAEVVSQILQDDPAWGVYETNATTTNLAPSDLEQSTGEVVRP